MQFPCLFSIKNTQELLRLNKNDPREKLLYFSAEHDHNNALTPASYEKVLQPLAEKFDIKYKVISSFDEICQEISEAQKTGKLSYVIINAHGSPKEMKFSEPDPKDQFKDKLISQSHLLNYPSCFSGLHPSGKIVLFSCCTGSPGTIPDKDCFPVTNDNKNHNPSYRPFAQILANYAKRQVIGAVTAVSGYFTQLTSIDPLMLDHPGVPPFPTNLFRTFKPRQPNCQVLNSANMHPRELLAADAIKTDLASKSLMLNNAAFLQTQNFLKICKEDPREKVLFLDAHAGFNGEINHPNDNPIHYAELLSTLADKFDLKYKVIEFYDDICHEIHDASAAGKVAAVMIRSYAAPQSKGLLLSKGDGTGQRVIDENTDFSKCFSGIQPSGRIFIIGSSSGASKDGDPYNSLAQKVATVSQRTTVAAIEPLNVKNIKITSIDPLMINSEGSSWLSLVTNKLFRIFNPELTTCPPVAENRVLPREKIAADVIKSNLVQSSLLSDSAQFKETQEYLRLCKEDPREKFLFLSAEAESDILTKQLDPNNFKKTLSDLAKQHDLKYKVVASYEDICKEIQEASKIGKLAGVYIQGNSLASSSYTQPLGTLLGCKDFSCTTLPSNGGSTLQTNPLCENPGILLSENNKFEPQQQCTYTGSSLLGPSKKWNVVFKGQDFSECFLGSDQAPVTLFILDPTGLEASNKKTSEFISLTLAMQLYEKLKVPLQLLSIMAF